MQAPNSKPILGKILHCKHDSKCSCIVKENLFDNCSFSHVVQYWANKTRQNKNNEAGICYLDHNKRVDLTVLALLSWCHIELKKSGNIEADRSKKLLYS